MKLAIMQPYFFPYLGYFQLVNSVDKFIFYDDVNFIKGGWINRNNILVNGKEKYFTLNLEGSSSNKKINEINIGNNSKKILKTIQQNYSKAPFFNQAYPTIENVFNSIKDKTLISQIAAKSVIKVAEYLHLNKKFEYSSINYYHTNVLKKSERLIMICKINNANTYVNTIGGMKLYSKSEFQKEKINLFFLKSELTVYEQFSSEFKPYLSIIDVMMFNSPERINQMLTKFSLL